MLMKDYDYAVSFCIPTYNRSELIWKVVTEILASTESGFQVVVSDNGSTDNTWERLSSISDSRLKLCRNPYASDPPQLNWLNALNEGDGKWLYLVMGRDLIGGYDISRLIARLEAAEKKKVAFIYDNCASGPDAKCYRYYDKKIDALKRFMMPMHQTGNIFRKDVFMTIPNKEKACKTIDTFPENYFKSKIIEKWNCMELPGIVNKEAGWAWGGQIPRSTFDTNPNSLCWFPNRKILQGIQTMDLIKRHSLTSTEHDRLFEWEWRLMIREVSTAFKERMMDTKKYTYHYGVKPRNVTKKEMISNILQAYHKVNRCYPHMSFCRKRKMRAVMIDKMCEILLEPYYSRLKVRLRKFPFDILPTIL